MSNIFNSVKGLHPKRNKFTADTYRNDFTAPLGVNIPCFWAEVPPATRFKVNASTLVRLQALIAPVMDNIDYYVHFWKVPYRLLENDRFTKFITGEITPEEYDAIFETPYTLAEIVADYLPSDYDEHAEKISWYNKIFGDGSILDFLGYDKSLFPVYSYDSVNDEFILTGGNNTTKLNWRGLLVYFMIHQNWYMNENVPYFEGFIEWTDDMIKTQNINSLAILLVHSLKCTDNYCSFLPHGWTKDYFTSALPNVQYGDPVQISIGGSAPVRLSDDFGGMYLDGTGSMLNPKLSVNGVTTQAIDQILSAVGTHGSASIYTGTNDPETPQDDRDAVNSIGSQNVSINGTPSFYDDDNQSLTNFAVADLSEARSITINELRFANALQIFKERQMRYGRRRLEYYKGFFDVEPEDLRLQVPKYLGGGRIPINISDIEQTSATSGGQALGRLAGKATAVAGGFAGFSTFCSEETFIIGISFAMPHQTYAQQLSRFKMKTNDPYDYFNPSFEHLGEQPVYNIEVFAGSDNPLGEFGYQPRFTEYRFHMNEMHGEFKNTLAYWTLGRIFDSTPALNAEFIYMQPKVFDRIFAVSNQPNMLVSMLFQTRAIKPVSKYGTPMLLS